MWSVLSISYDNVLVHMQTSINKEKEEGKSNKDNYWKHQRNELSTRFQNIMNSLCPSQPHVWFNGTEEPVKSPLKSDHKEILLMDK